MLKNILTPEGKIVRCVNEKKILLEGLESCLDKMTRMNTYTEANNYLMYGDSEINLKEEVARLLLVATALPKDKSPFSDISKKVIENHVVDINSMFIKEFLSLEERNKNNSFMNSEFYNLISLKVEEMDLVYQHDKKLYLNDILILMKNIRNLYIANIDQNIGYNKLDVRYRELLIELFQNNLDYTLTKLKNGVKSNV